MIDLENMNETQAIEHGAMLFRSLQGGNEPDAPQAAGDTLYELGLVLNRLHELWE